MTAYCTVTAQLSRLRKKKRGPYKPSCTKNFYAYGKTYRSSTTKKRK
jgi:hypothetical protein